MQFAMSSSARVSMTQFCLERDQHKNCPVLRVSGQFTSQYINEFRHCLDEIIASDVTRVYVDMESLSFIDSLGIGVLIFYYNHLRRDGMEIVLLKPSAAIREILQVTSLDRVIPIEDS